MYRPAIGDDQVTGKGACPLSLKYTPKLYDVNKKTITGGVK